MRGRRCDGESNVAPAPVGAAAAVFWDIVIAGLYGGAQWCRCDGAVCGETECSRSARVHVVHVERAVVPLSLSAVVLCTLYSLKAHYSFGTHTQKGTRIAIVQSRALATRRRSFSVVICWGWHSLPINFFLCCTQHEDNRIGKFSQNS